ncbi:MAG: hypothetical protein IT460_02835 [Planctomycetes bacterium]|nr:hypothetical protein [Planctomycetota bacterium]
MTTVHEPVPPATSRDAAAPPTAAAIEAAAPAAGPTIAWQIDVSLLGNPVQRRSLLRALALSAGLAASLVGLVILFATGEPRTAGTIAAVVAAATVALFVVGVLGFFVLIGTKQPYAYRMDDEGIEMINASRAAKRVHRTALILGFLAGRPGAVSAGAAGMATECVHCAWSEVKHLEDRAQDRAIYLRGDVFTRLWVFCTPENHATVRAFVLAHVRR